ncbi:uncharacterized protein LOC116294529 isoform X3 [Actinia tenebrosa]|uniref:Uncharacterized protein LOC116294529 isoform X3 n=1 Tax=Actinia tenebrosa TaxID=6105 RepID=A0A6P8HNS9_ACTTE|nr:uncharacterized protein LOC116294529 isoform X3 [Actinia tenebrosa]
MIGQNDVSSCRNIALLVAFTLLNINQVTAKFNVTLNETTPLLTNIEMFVNLPFEKIAWGLKVKGSDWPIVAAVSLNHLAGVTSTTVQQMKNLTMADVTDKIVSSKAHFTSKLSALHNTLVAQASSIFALSASETCGQWNIPTNDILKTFLSHLGGSTYLDPQNVSFVAGYECIKHDNMLLLPSKWSMLVPHIIPKSFANISTLLGITKQQLADIHALPKGETINMTLRQYIDITKSRIHPLFKCRESMKNDIVLTKAQSKGVSVSLIGKQNVLQILMMMCSDVSISNMSVVMDWSPDNMTVLGNYTMEDAALCKRMPVNIVISRTLMALVTMILNEVHKCVIVPCPSGTLVDYQTCKAKGVFSTHS